MSSTLLIKATEPQTRFHEMTCKYPLFVAGFGSGKSEAMVNQGIIDASHSSSALIAMYEPTYDLVRLILAPRLCEKLTEHGIRYTYNKSENIIYVSNGQFGDFVLRTLDNPERIVGYESYRAHIDELDTLKEDKARDAWNKVVARNRQRPEGIEDVFNRVSAYTTPEGFKFVYNRWVTNKTELYDMVQAPTASNPYLPKDYIESLRNTYPAELINAYLEGEFVNLTAGTVYRSYDRDAQDSTEAVRDNETIYVGMDFNIDHMAATIYVKRDKTWHAVDEISEAYNTPAVITTLKSRYLKNTIILYPDASGGARDSSAAHSDVTLLEQAGFKIRVRGRSYDKHGKNPLVRDRVNAMNAALEQGRIRINATLCPRTAECLEQQAYDKNGQPDKTTGVDHQNDATTYPIAYEMSIKKPVLSLDMKFKT